VQELNKFRQIIHGGRFDANALVHPSLFQISGHSAIPTSACDTEFTIQFRKSVVHHGRSTVRARIREIAGKERV
jgi:hypothetical protein